MFCDFLNIYKLVQFLCREHMYVHFNAQLLICWMEQIGKNEHKMCVVGQMIRLLTRL